MHGGRLGLLCLRGEPDFSFIDVLLFLYCLFSDTF